MAAGRVLVTGGAGFIGSHLCERLIEEGLQVTVLDDLSAGRAENVPPGADLVVGDVCEPDVVGPLTGRADVVFHLAAQVSIRASMAGFSRDARINLMGTVNLLDACVRRPSPRKFILASSMGVYADAPSPEPIAEDHPTNPLAPYGVGKLASEHYVKLVAKQAGFQAACLRYFNTYGPRQGYTPYVGVVTIFIRRLLSGQHPVIFGDGSQCRDFVHVRDVVEANILAMRKDHAEPGVYNVGSGRGTTVGELARWLCDRLAPGERAEHTGAHPGELKYSIADIHKARKELGYAPRGELARDLDAVIRWCRDQATAGPTHDQSRR
jgi:UDP-glucose 4-epimerase